jgi:hypothetical protein
VRREVPEEDFPIPSACVETGPGCRRILEYLFATVKKWC